MKKNIPNISIIIPAYNEEKYVDNCLQSILSQNTSFPYEIIVVDNNSTDKTCQKVSKYPVISVIEKRPGASVSRNTGAKISKGNILYFVDADCRLPPNQIEKISQAFRNNKNLNIVAGNYIYDQDGFLPYFFTKTLKYFYFYHRLIKLLFGIKQFSGGNFAIKRQDFDKVLGFNENIYDQKIVPPDDLDLAVRLHKSGIRNLLYSPNFAVYSSFRRFKKFSFKQVWVRFFQTVRILTA